MRVAMQYVFTTAITICVCHGNMCLPRQPTVLFLLPRQLHRARDSHAPLKSLRYPCS